ncbi:hypothetical protein IBE11_08210 [Francisella tularensis subsp. novicida]|uniref:lipase family protein n=1 Tax=Francisella tularensis TaxID=263 RepID=UPI000158AEDF|nr:hypothetical protein [Francisella tularensis]AJI45021.1 PGAP1-like family protein [Francisella tularensis subsp. novicida F6168]AJJ46535.1 PGAP1-like family protein [Francisella tularensis subsp. novicida]APC99677.1 PGAP1-like family protein [Francisella tularensis subsp. novicida]EDN36802.1 predicted protein [Francisella tularensis subsp. novicida GA99-3549]KFJ68111.1 PGAP1-like family protein [Francisella tularensis subsp. novicida]
MKKIVLLGLALSSSLSFGSEYVNLLARNNINSPELVNISQQLDDIHNLELNEADLTQKMDKLQSDLSKSKKDLELESSGSYLNLYHWFVNRKQSGYLSKYDYTSFPADSLYRKIKPEEISMYARLTSEVYDMSKEAALSPDDETYNDTQESINFYENLLGKVKDKLSRKEINKIIKEAEGYDNNLLLDKKVSNVKSLKTNLREIIKNLKKEQNKEKSLDNQFVKNLKGSVIFDELATSEFEIVNILYRNNSELSGVILYSAKENKMIIVYAGSKSTSDWIGNLQAWGSTGNAKHNVGEGGFSIHKGIETMYTKELTPVKKSIKEFIDKYSNTTPPEIIVLGHSLGGSLSTLMAYHIKSHILPVYAKNNPVIENAKVYNISFGAPRFVDSKGAKIIEEKVGKGNIIRFWNARDLVPSIMLGSLNSKHVGIDIPLKDRFSHEWYKPILTHHSMQRYWNLSKESFEEVRGENIKKINQQDDISILADYLEYLTESNDATKDRIKQLREELRHYSKDTLTQAKLELKAKLKQIINKLEENITSGNNDMESRKEIDELKFLILEIEKIQPLKVSMDTSKPKGLTKSILKLKAQLESDDDLSTDDEEEWQIL